MGEDRAARDQRIIQMRIDGHHADDIAAEAGVSPRTVYQVLIGHGVPRWGPLGDPVGWAWRRRKAVELRRRGWVVDRISEALDVSRESIHKWCAAEQVVDPVKSRQVRKPTPATKARDREIMRLHAAGWNQVRIGERFGITGARVGQIIARDTRPENDGSPGH